MKIYKTKDSDETLDEDDCTIIKELGIKWACYWYMIDGYEGEGLLIMRYNKKWFVHDLAHCSCYGPLEYLKLEESYNELDILINKYSNDFYGYGKNDIYKLKEIIDNHKKEWESL